MNTSRRRSSRIVQLPTAPPPPPPEEPKRRFPWWTLAVIAVCACVLVGLYALVQRQFDEYDRFTRMCAVVAQDVFHGPVYIDDLSIQGMTMDEAREALQGQASAQAGAFEITLASGDTQWRITSEDVPMTWNTEGLLTQARMIGRSGTLEERYQQITTITEPVYLYSEFTYDQDAVRVRTNAIAEHLTEEATNASVIAFNVSDRSFAFADEKPGRQVDAGALYDMVIAALDRGEYGSTLTVPVTDVLPAITRAELERNYTRIASYTTNTTSDSNRNTNIELAAYALNGKMIQPGETISFNETTGQRLAEKGYLPAGAIENGRTVQEYGGGVCQVSTTLFNALVRADCAIVSRKPHAWPSDYVPRGEDAAVDWPGLDLVMRNTSDTPMFITAWYEDRKITVEVYGMSLGEGMSIELESETTYSKTPTEVKYTYNAQLPIGTEQLLRSPRTGYSVQTYKIWLQNGVEVSREQLYTSEYSVIYEEYEYNDGNPPPEA